MTTEKLIYAFEDGVFAVCVPGYGSVVIDTTLWRPESLDRAVVQGLKTKIQNAGALPKGTSKAKKMEAVHDMAVHLATYEWTKKSTHIEAERALEKVLQALVDTRKYTSINEAREDLGL